MAGLYIHVPFCKSRCIYCGFYSTTLTNLGGDYVDALCREMDLRQDIGLKRPPRGKRKSPNAQMPGVEPVGTIYLGGGTPSQLQPSDLRRLLLYIYKVYDVAGDAEVTIEVNPDDISPAMTQALALMPVNRVSMGVQTFSDERLRWLRRRHTAKQAREAVGQLREAGIDNISIDLMFGFPGQTLEQWDDDLQQAISLGVEHISAYSLMIEEGTPLHAMMNRPDKENQADGNGNQSQTPLRPIDEETSRAMYDRLIDRLSHAGYEHYEISNFARPGFRSRHNSSYWHDVPYLGLGAAAHSFDRKSRSWNVSDVRQYIEMIGQGQLPTEERELIDAPTRYNDRVMTALRTREGICLEQLRRDLGEPFHQYLMANAAPHIARQCLATDGDRMHLTRSGLYVSDDIMSDLMWV